MTTTRIDEFWTNISDQLTKIRTAQPDTVAQHGNNHGPPVPMSLT